MKKSLLTLAPLVLSVACGGAPQQASESANNPPASGGGGRAQLDAKKISVAMRGNEDIYRKCFMQAIGSRGAVTLKFAVDTRGEVKEAAIDWSSIGKESVGQCLIERFGEQRFGEQASAAEGRWTFVFNLSDPLDEGQREELLQQAEEADENSFQVLPESRGSIDAAMLDEIVQLNYPLYAHCYRDSIKRRGESRGLLRFRLHINEEGKLTDIDDAGSVLPDPYAVDCIAEAFFAMDFPKAQGGPVLVKYGVDFE